MGAPLESVGCGAAEGPSAADDVAGSGSGSAARCPVVEEFPGGVPVDAGDEESGTDGARRVGS